MAQPSCRSKMSRPTTRSTSPRGLRNCGPPGPTTSDSPAAIRGRRATECSKWFELPPATGHELGAVVEPMSDVFDDWWPHPTMMTSAPGVSYLQYQAAADARCGWWEGLRRVFADHDLLLSTTILHVAFEVERWSAAWGFASQEYPNGSFVPTWTAHTFPHNWLGWPAVSIPCGFVDGLPVGLQITGRPNEEALVLRASAAYLGAFGSTARPPAA